MDWRDVLRRRVAESISITDRVEAAVRIAAEWLTEQVAVHPSAAGLCLEFVSKHIIRRARMANGSRDSPEELTAGMFLHEQLQKRGVDASGISVKIMAEMPVPKKKKAFERKSRSMPRRRERSGW